MKNNSEIISIRNAVNKTAKKFPILKVYLFGSIARNNYNESSDIDLCLETERGFSLIDAGLFAEAIKNICGRKVDVITDRNLIPTTRANIHNDRILLYERA